MQADRLAEQALTAEDLRIALLVRGVVRQEVREHALTASEQEWVRLAIQREGRREKLRSAVIEKTLTALIWAALAGLGYALVEAARSFITSIRPH
jgi:SOS response regulatory protein OraA/RecX